MAKKYGKNINFLKKQTPQPSTQVSGVPLQSLSGLSNLSKAVTLRVKVCGKEQPQCLGVVIGLKVVPLVMVLF